MNHIRSSQHPTYKPYSTRRDQRFYRTLCGQYLRYASTTPIKHEINCEECIRGLIAKKEAEVENLKRIWL